MARGKPPTVGANGGKVIVTSRGKLTIDVKKIAKAVGAAAVGHVLERVDEGLDILDRPFAPYSKGYRAFLRAGGEDPDKVDLRLTGGLLNSVHVRAETLEGDVATVTIGPDTGTSPHVAPKRTKRGTLPKRRSMSRSGARSPPHNVLGAILQRRRPWLGISPKGMAMLRRLIERIGWSGGE